MCEWSIEGGLGELSHEWMRRVVGGWVRSGTSAIGRESQQVVRKKVKKGMVETKRRRLEKLESGLESSGLQGTTLKTKT